MLGSRGEEGTWADDARGPCRGRARRAGEAGRGVCWGRRRLDGAAWAGAVLVRREWRAGNLRGGGALSSAGLRGSALGRGLDVGTPQPGAEAGGVSRGREEFPAALGRRPPGGAGAGERLRGGSGAVITGGAAGGGGGGGRGSGAGPRGGGCLLPGLKSLCEVEKGALSWRKQAALGLW